MTALAKPKVRVKAGRGYTPAASAAGMITVVGSKTPFRLERISCVAPSGQTIAELIGQACGGKIDPELLQFGRAFVGPEQFDPEVWHRTRPKPNTVLSFRIIHEDSTALKIVLSIAIVVAAVYAGPLLAGAALGTTAGAAGTAGALGFGATLGTFTAVSTAATLGIALAGNFLLNALIPRSQPSLKQQAPSPTYSYGGSRNVANPDGPVPLLLGRHKMAPMFGVKPVTELVGNDVYAIHYLVWGYGPIGRQDYKIGRTPLDDYDDFEVEDRDGLPGDAPLTLWFGLPNEDQFTIDLSEGADWSVRRTAANADKFTFEWLFAGGLFKVSESKGKIKEASGVVEAQYRRVGDADWVPIGVFDVEEKKQEPFRKGHTVFPAGGRGQFDVRLRCTEDNSQAENIQWTTLRSFTNAAPTTFPYPLAVTVLRMKMNGQLSGVIDTFNGIASSRCPDWDHVTETWIERETSNPASLYRYVLEHPANEDRVESIDEIDLVKLQVWHDYCRVRGLEFNQVRDFVSGAYALLQDIAAAGHATPDWVDGLETVVIDQPSDLVVQAIGPQTSWGFKVVRAYRDIPDAVRVRFVDAAGDYNTKAQRLVIRDGVAPEDVRNTETAEKTGVVHAGQVWKEVQRDLLELEYRPDEYSVNVRWLDLICDRGDRIQVAHDVLRLAAGRTGRVMQTGGAGAVRWVRLDEPVRMEAGKLYAVRFTHQDGSQIVRSVLTVPGETRLIRLLGPGDLPEETNIFFFGEADRESRALIVKSIERQSDFVARLVMVDMAPEIDAADSMVPPPWTPREPSPLDDAPAVPKITAILSGDLAQVVGDDGTVLQPVIVGVGAGSGAPITTDRFELRYRLEGSSEWSSVTIPADKASTWLLGYDPGDILQLMLRAWSPAGEPSLWSPMIEYTVLGRTRRPPNVATFAYTGLSNGLRRFSWTLADPEGDGPPLDLAGYEIRYRAGTWANWADLGPLHLGVLTSQPHDTVTPQVAGTYTFGIVARLTDGQVSAVPLLSVVVLPNGVAPNVPKVLVSPSTPTNDNTLSFSGTADAGSTMHMLVDGVDVASVAVVAGAWALTSPAVADGSRSVTFTTADSGGHHSDPTAPIVILVDATAPAAPVISGGPTINTTDTTPTITGTGETGSSLELFKGGVAVGSPVPVTGSAWSLDMPTQAIGSYALTARQTDAVGNPSALSSTVTLNVNPLSIAIATPAGGASTYDRRQPCTGAGAMPGATIKLYSGVTQYGSATADGSGNWSLTPGSDIPLGTANYFVTQTVSGRESAAGATTSLTVVAIDADAWAWIAAMTVRPDFARQTLIKTLVDSLKTAGVWAKLDALYLLAAHDAQAARLNGRAPGTFTLTATSSPIFTADRDYKGTGLGSTPGGYLATTFNPSTAGGVYARDSAHIGDWVRTASTATLAGQAGDVGTSGASIFSKHPTAGMITTMLNDGTLSNTAAGAPNNVGHFLISRTASTGYAKYHQGAAQASSSVVSTAVPNFNFSVLRAGTAYSDAEVCATHWGSGLTATEAGDFYTALQTYLTGVGAI
ncbi:TipJ family phage tail tip protein [Inquilinus sp. CA228]|uniref:TipJ family phage tail tip protein n=1 Tax=Inquilinus sp. CA228 TaxID=3455609 RepID=UPI003F8D052B